jgi:YHS domain-containing protein
MKKLKFIAIVILVAAFVAISLTSRADDQTKPKPYPLNTCLVCGMKFDSMSKPYIFVYKGQEIKLCDKSEKADFDKAPDKYIKKLADAEAKLKK